MTDISVAAIDRLQRYGIIESEGDSYLNRAFASANNIQATTNNQQDTFNQQVASTSVSQVKTYGAIALLTYLTGVVCSKGKVNPIDCAKGIYEVCAKAFNGFCKIFKKS